MAKKVIASEIIIKTTDGGSFSVTGRQAEKLAKQLDKTGRSAQTTDRAMKGVTQQSSNTTKEFSKMATMQGGLVQTYAIIAAQVFALSAAFQFLKNSMETRNLIEGQKAFGAVTGVAYASMTKQIQAATSSMLSFKEAASAGAIGTAAGLTTSQLTQLATVAKNASLALGRDLTDSFNRLIRGVTKAEPELLDELGIILRLENATTKYAVSIGKTRDQLNAYERTQAVLNDVLEQGETKFSQIQKLMDPDAFALGQLMKELDDLLLSFQKFMVDALLPLIGFFKDNSLALVSAMGLFIFPIIKSMLPNLTAAFDDSVVAMKASGAAAKSEFMAMRSSFGEVGDAFANRPIDKDKSAAFFDTHGAKQKSGNANQARLNQRQIAAYRRHLQERNGIFKTMNKGQRREFARHLNTQEALLKGYHVKTMTLEKAADTTWRGIWAGKTAVVKAATAAWQGMLAGAAAFANKVFAAAGWLGMAAMVVMSIKSMIDAVSATDDAYRRSKKETDDLTDATKQLNDELARSAKVRRDVTLLGLMGGVESSGASLQSADIPTLIKNYNSERKKGHGVDSKVIKGFREQATAASLFAPELAFLVDTMDKGGRVTDDAAAAAERIANQYINAGQAAKSLTQNQQALNKAIDQQIRKFTKIPYMDMLTSYSTTIQGGLDALGLFEIGSGINEPENYNERTYGGGKFGLRRNADGNLMGAAGEYSKEAGRARKQQRQLREGLSVSSRYKGVMYGDSNATQKDLTGFSRDSVYDIMFANRENFGDIIGDSSDKQIYQPGQGKMNTVDLFSKRDAEGYGMELKPLEQVKEEIEAAGFYNKTMKGYALEAYQIAEENLNKRKEVSAQLIKENREFFDQVEISRQQAVVRNKILDLQKQGLDFQFTALTNEKTLTDLQTQGTTIANKKAIILQQIKGIEDTNNKARLKVTEAETAEVAVQEKIKGILQTKGEDLEYLNSLNSDELITLAAKHKITTKELENAKQGVTNAGLELDIEKNKGELRRQALQLSAALLEKQQLVTDETRKQASMMRAQAVLAKTIAMNLKLGGGTGASRAAQRNAKLEANKTKREQLGATAGAYNTQATSLTTQADFGVMGARDADGLIIATKNKFQEKYNELIKKEIALRQQIKLIEKDDEDLENLNQGKYIMANLKGLQETARIQREQVYSLNPAPELYNQTVNALLADGVEAKNIDYELIKKQVTETKNLQIETELMSGIQNTLSNGFVSMFQAMVDGTKDFKDAMKDLTYTVLADLAAMFAKAAALKIMMAMFPGMGNMMEGISSIPGMGRYGGQMTKYRTGGVAQGPNSGYLAMLHGREAVVPLGNDRSIPVDMRGMPGGGNTVNVSISMNGQGQGTSQVSGDGMQGLGRSIGNLVQQHLQQEMRPGGLLNQQGTKGRA